MADPISLKPGAPNEAGELKKAGMRQSLGLITSTSGGADRVPKFDLDGDLTTGPFDNDSDLGGTGGNVFLPDTRALAWLKKDGTLSGFSLTAWQDHDSNGGELLIQSPFRTALIQKGAFQLGDNSAGLRAFYLHLVSGEANSTRTIRHSPALSFQTRTWNSGSEVVRRFALQAVPTDATNATVNLRGYCNAAITEEDTAFGSYTNSAGLVTGDLAFELSPSGLWTPGTSPAVTALSDGATVTITASKYKTYQNAAVTLAGSRTLAFSGVTDGMRGTIMVTQGGGGPHTLTMPSGVIVPSGFALSTSAGQTDRLEWFSANSKIYLHRAQAFPYVLDSDVSAFLTRAGISDGTIEAATNQLVADLKAAGVYSLLDCAFPLVGGTSTSHSKNLLADNRHITWLGTPTHNSNGVTGDGSAAGGLIDFDFSDRVGGQDSAFLYVYSRTQSPTVGGTFLGSFGGTNSARAGLRANSSANAALDGINLNSLATISASVSSDYRRHLAGIRTDSGNQALFINGTKSSGASTTTGVANQNFGILCRNNGSLRDQFSNANLAFVAIGQAPSDSQYAAFRAAIDAFQTALGRANP